MPNLRLTVLGMVVALGALPIVSPAWAYDQGVAETATDTTVTTIEFPPGEPIIEPYGEVFENGYQDRRLIDRGMDKAAIGTRSLSLFAGVHGFKGPTDLGRNGNFGFHEGMNFGAPIGDPWGFSYQVGFQATHSNFLGNESIEGGLLPHVSGAGRNQIFLTAGVFRRAFGGGMQTGVVFDLFYDDYYRATTLQQIRSETAFVLSDLREIGYWGAYGISQDTITDLGKFDTLLDPTDIFAAFYRRHFTGGGQGRVWLGLSGDGDVVCGLDGTVPLGTSWALENNFTALFPKHGRRNGRTDEAWSVSIQLVWYPGRSARRVFLNPSQPLFYVADNSWFLVDRRN